MAEVDIRTVQELLGHKTITLTVRHSHLAPKHTLAAVEQFGRPYRDLSRHHYRHQRL
jgi:site-specific recombinase XerD